MYSHPIADKAAWLRSNRTPTWRLWLYASCFLFGVTIAPSAVEQWSLQHYQPEPAVPSQYTVIEKIALHIGACN